MWIILAIIAAVATLILPISSIVTGMGVFLVGQAFTLLSHRQQSQSALANQSSDKAGAPPSETIGAEPSTLDTTKNLLVRNYRVPELQRIIASLKANAPLLVVGKEGMGKSELAKAVVRQLRDEEYTVANIELSTPKRMLTDIAKQLDVDTQKLDGKVIPLDELRALISKSFQQNTAFLVVDDAHRLDAKFRDWLKTLKWQGVPMLLLANDPPRSDIFVNLPRIELAPLPEYAIREVMEQQAIFRGLNLKPHQLAVLQERTGGNPMLAKRVIDEEYLGLENEAGDHHRYFDITPLILLVGTVFIMMRFAAMGLNNPSLYILTAMFGTLMMGIYRLVNKLPKESQRIQS